MDGVNGLFLIDCNGKQPLTNEQIGSVRSASIVQEVSKGKSKRKDSETRYGKTDSRYWAAGKRLYKNTFTWNGEQRATAHWCVKIRLGKRRQTLNLRTPNKTVAASKAANFYKDLVAGGWEFALGRLRPETLQVKPITATVGQLIEVARVLSSVRKETFDGYAKALRKLAADLMGIEDGRKHSAGDGNEAWRRKVDQIDVAELTPAAVHAWKNKRLKAAKTTVQRGRAALTVNSILRNSKAILNKKIKGFVAEQLALPKVLWFEGVTMEPEPSLRYRSRIDAKKIIQSAQAELADQQPELYKLLLLTLVCGLRRSEADKLLWNQIDLATGIISIHDTEAKRLKSKDSAGDIALDAEVLSVFKKFKESATGGFVLEIPPSSRLKERERKSRAYRCDATENALINWLKEKGVPGLRPIHTMRKEIGSIIAHTDGIFKASRYLRHSDIRITAKLYADTKEPVRAGLGSLFATSEQPTNAS